MFNFKQTNKISIRMLMVAVVICCILFSGLQYSFAIAKTSAVPAETTAVKAPYSLSVARMSDTALKLRWTKVSAAAGYEVYRYSTAKKKYTSIKIIKGSSKTAWTNKKLKPNKKYAYKVRSFTKLSGKKVYSEFTYSVNAITNKTSYNKVNANDIKSEKLVRIGINQVLTVKGTALPSKKDRKANKKVLSKKLRLMVTASGNVAKDTKGRLIGKLPGNANVYFMAHNGYKKKIDVKVVDYAKPAKWKNLDEVDSYPRQLLIDYKVQMNEIASYFSINGGKPYGVSFHLNNDGDFIIEDDPYSPHSPVNSRPDLENVLPYIKELLNSSYSISIYVTVSGDVEFSVGLPDDKRTHYDITFDIQKDIPQSVADQFGIVKLSPHWECRKFIESGM